MSKPDPEIDPITLLPPNLQIYIRAANPIARLLGSSKALVMICVVAASFVALWLGRVSWEEIRPFLEWTIGIWLGSQAAEDVARHIAAPKMQAEVTRAVVTADTIQRLSNPPPAPEIDTPPTPRNVG